MINLARPDLPMQYQATVTYQGDDGHGYGSTVGGARQASESPLWSLFMARGFIVAADALKTTIDGIDPSTVWGEWQRALTLVNTRRSPAPRTPTSTARST